jgi:hypothetical protein
VIGRTATIRTIAFALNFTVSDFTLSRKIFCTVAHLAGPYLADDGMVRARILALIEYISRLQE